MGPQAEFQFIVQLTNAVRNFDRLKVIVFQDIVDGRLGGDAVILQDARPLSSQDNRGHAKHGVFKDLLIRQLSLSDLFIKPTHSLPPQSLVISSV